MDGQLEKLMYEVIGRLRALEEKIMGMHYDQAKAKVAQIKKEVAARATSGNDVDLVELSDPETERALEYLRNVRRLMPKSEEPLTKG